MFLAGGMVSPELPTILNTFELEINGAFNEKFDYSVPLLQKSNLSSSVFKEYVGMVGGQQLVS